MPTAPEGQLPSPPSERRAWLLAAVLLALGVAVLVAVLAGVVGSTSSQVASVDPPAVPAVVATPSPGAVASGAVSPAGSSDASAAPSRTAAKRASRARHGHKSTPSIVARPSSVEQHRDLTRFEDLTATHISTAWMQGFYPIYAAAQSTFGVNWLLVASIHKQESAFSTDPTTYHGLNFAGCCGGPMQFNVTNGPVSTWQLVSDSYSYGKRPAAYDHETPSHPSLYDDFDAIMAGAHLLSSDGAGYALDDTAWDAAYDYYGHDATGVTYADQVLARAIGWSQHGFCINCGLETALVSAVHEAYGAPVLASLTTATAAKR
jgi:hypothetical protein